MSAKRITTKNGEVRWEVRVYENGRGSKRLKKIFDRKIDAEKFLLEFEKKKQELAENPFPSITFKDRTFNSESTYWLEDADSKFSPGHKVKAKEVVSSFIKVFPNLPIEKMTPEFLSKYQQAEFKKGLAPSTCNRKTEILMAVLNHSVKHRRIPFHPAQGFTKMKKTFLEMKFLTEGEARHFLRHIDQKYPRHTKDRWIFIVYLLAINTGMRAGEIWGLKRCDINSTRGIISVCRQFNRVSQELAQTKSGKGRDVPCNDHLREELKVWCMSNTIAMDDLVFSTETGLPICHENFIARRFKQDIRAWGGKTIRFHDLRHTAITLLISKKVDIKTVKEIAGHANIQTTMNYSHLLSDAVEKVSKEFQIIPAEKYADLKLVVNPEDHDISCAR
ncbi:tyrosine-type recombinase/integrase [Bdellovibrio svalbardensis]|uniref:Site-specific integrase n=1 Tax=Bdellovibrio svalbardensis TaxID=2972972 RepID=A0ABT6DIU3_9BACT|nr:site-specific integrase [Bdellovibrio svalbardensis]MDG0816422.1 site-specific integrase [Bdellovibrio svalbardensis]